MKTKRIVALALTAAMAVSMASMTAFAAEGDTWSQYQENITVKDTDTYKENAQAYALKFQVVKPGDGSETEDPEYFIFRKGSTVTEKTSNGVTTKEYTINTADTTQVGTEKASVLFKDAKKVGKHFGAPSTVEEDNWMFMGWSVETTDQCDPNAATLLPADTKASDAKILSDGDDLIKNSTVGSVLKIYPVFREKSAKEKQESAAAILARPKVAKSADDKDWTYTQQELDKAKTSNPLGEDASQDALAKCNAEMKHSRVYDIKPVAKDGKVVTLKKGIQVDVEIPISTLYEGKTETQVNQLIKDGKLKVFHIGSDGKSHPVTSIKSSGDGKYVTFKYGTFSEFVITKDPNAKAQAGEEEGASGGNPATGEASTLPVAMLALAALSATGIVAYKKRKAE